MFRRFSHHLPHYFQKHLSRQLEELYLSVAIQDFALAAVVLFEPIYLYGLGFSIRDILMYYIVVYALYYILVPLGGKFVARFGPERSIAISTVFLVFYYASLFLVPDWNWFFWVAPVMFAFQKMFYWPAYHTDFMVASDQGERGKEYSGLWSLSTLMYILGPAAGGLLITFFGFHGLFTFVILTIIVSSVPLFVSKVKPPRESFSYWESFWQPFTRFHLRSTLGYLALGEELILLVIWPIFIALTFKSFASIGGAVAAATLVTALVTLYIGKVIDQGRRPLALRWASIITALGWFVRPWLRAVPLVFASDTVGRIVKNTTFVSLTSITYEKALKEHSLTERAVFFEQGFAIAKMLMAAGVIILMNWLQPFTAAFMAAGAVSFLYLVFARR